MLVQDGVRTSQGVASGFSFVVRDEGNTVCNCSFIVLLPGIVTAMVELRALSFHKVINSPDRND